MSQSNIVGNVDTTVVGSGYAVRRLEILRSLQSTKCEACGSSKKAMKSHCSRCYFKLPKRLQRNLYLGFGVGYEEAFEISLTFLALTLPDPTNR
jgi:uncharacterized paraquat-inducible protein A